jgi:hypothetical protein
MFFVFVLLEIPPTAFTLSSLIAWEYLWDGWLRVGTYKLTLFEPAVMFHSTTQMYHRTYCLVQSAFVGGFHGESFSTSLPVLSCFV